MMISKSKLLIFTVSLLFLTACNGGSSNDNDADTGTDTSQHTISLSKSYTAFSGDDVRRQLKSIGITDVKNISVDLSMDPTSTVERGGDDSSARLETDVLLTYRDSSNSGGFAAASRLLYVGNDKFDAYSYIEVCSDGECVYVEKYDSDIGGSLGDSVNVSVTYDDANQEFVHTIGSTTQRNTLGDLQALPGAGGFNFMDYSLQDTIVRGGVRKIRQTGDSGSLVLELHSVSHDGNLFDDFSSDTLNPNKWSAETNDDAQAPQSPTVTVVKEFTTASEDDNETDLTPIGVTDANNISVDLLVDPSSTLTKADDSNARLEVRAQLRYSSTSDDSEFYAASNLQYNGSSFGASSFIEKCSNGECVVTSEYTGNIAVSFGETVTISVTYDAANQQFIHNIGPATHVISLATLQTKLDEAAAGSLDFTNYSFNRSLIRSEVKNIEQEGESGSLTIKLDKVSHDGVVYDEFDDEFLDPNKWSVRNSGN